MAPRRDLADLSVGAGGAAVGSTAGGTSADDPA
jgi:hypothetical protein